MKYVILRAGKQEFPIIFPNHMVHDEVAKAFMTMRDQPMTPVAVGEITFDIGSVTTHGRSTTLKLSSRPHDGAFINMFDYHHGWVE